MNNFTMLAQNSNYDYVTQACLAAMSIHATNRNPNICLITNDNVPEKYKQLFDYIIEIPWGDHAETYEWKIQNRWKIYHAVPYDETVVLDTDMLILEDLSTWFEFLKSYDLFFPTQVYNYRNELVPVDNVYRKAFTKFNLPNVYSGFHWFKKRDLPHEFYNWLEMITNNWHLFYKNYAGGKIYQKTCSIDVSSALAIKILNCENQITNKKVKYPSFVHMKPKIQGWNLHYGERWQDRVGVYLQEDLTLRIGNYIQSGVFHYTEKDFVNEKIIKTYEKFIGI